MRIVQLTPGTGNFHCGSCLHDNAAVKALRARGHDALMVPLYLPHVIDEPAASEDAPIFLGGIKVYLEERFPSFRRSPRWVDRLLSAPGLLRFSAQFAGMTSARELGESTLSMLRGEEGGQAGGTDRLIEWLQTQQPPDVVILSNSLLAGMAAPLKRQLGAAVVCSLQGEDSFLDGLGEPFRSQAWELLRQRCRDIDHFIAVSTYFGDTMRSRLGIDAARITVNHPGIAARDYGPPSPPDGPPVIGFLARMSRPKGLGLLVDAYIELVKRRGPAAVRLGVAGAMTGDDGKYVDGLKRKLAACGCLDAVAFVPNPDRAQKIAFLRSLSVFCTPATYGEAFGYYVLEAQASGVPVVQPQHGAFPEILGITGGGELCAPDDPQALAAALLRLLDDPERRRQLGAAGRKAVEASFSIEAMAGRLEVLLAAVAGRRS